MQVDDGLLFHWETGLCLWEIVAKAGKARNTQMQKAACDFFISHLDGCDTFPRVNSIHSPVDNC
jgi:hypothetical protein